MAELVLTERDGAVAVVLLNRPDALNALSDELMDELVSTLTELDRDEFDYEIVVERWKLPDKSDLVELSIKAEPGKAVQASEDFLAFLEKRGLAIDGDQQTKTRGALMFFKAGTGFD